MAKKTAKKTAKKAVKKTPKKTVKKTVKKAAEKTPKSSGLTRGYKSIGFTGTAGEYFGIWIVTLILTIITLGMYWPWAKVRRRRYFASHTGLAGFDMGYHATGWQLFKGFIIVVALVAIFYFAGYISPWIPIVTGVGLLFAYPWAINASLRFHARNTSWRNIRFDWKGRYWAMFGLLYAFFAAFAIGVGLTVLLILLEIWPAPLLALLFVASSIPVITRWNLNYYANRHSFGTVPFSADLPLGKTFAVFIITILVMILPFVLLFYLQFHLLGLLAVEVFSTGASFSFLQVAVFRVGIAIYALLYIAITIYGALCRNYLVQTMALGKAVKFDSSISAQRLIWIDFSNILAVIFTLGLMIPWATVRRYRYLCSVTGYKITGDIDSFVGGKTKKQSAFGEELAAAEGLDFGL